MYVHRFGHAKAYIAFSPSMASTFAHRLLPPTPVDCCHTFPHRWLPPFPIDCFHLTPSIASTISHRLFPHLYPSMASTFVHRWLPPSPIDCFHTFPHRLLPPFPTDCLHHSQLIAQERYRPCDHNSSSSHTLWFFRVLPSMSTNRHNQSTAISKMPALLYPVESDNRIGSVISSTGGANCHHRKH